MVLPASDRISRVPSYSRSTPTRCAAFRLRGFHPLWLPFPEAFCYTTLLSKPRDQSHARSGILLQHRICNAVRLTHIRFGLFPFRSPLLRESLFIFFSCRYLDGSVPCVFLPYPMYSRMDDRNLLRPGYPIRISRDQWMFAPPPGFSQLTTSFFVSWLRGIPRRPLFA